MNHLIPYKIFESNSNYDNLVQDIKDIANDLSDDGFGFKVYANYSSRTHLHIRIFNGYDFHIKHIKDTVNRMHECAKMYGFDNMTVKSVPASQGSTTSEVLPGGFMINFSTNKVSESLEDNHDIIKDITLDIQDLGLLVIVISDIDYHISPKDSRKCISIDIEGFFRIEDIKDSLDRLQSFADSIGCGLHIDPENKYLEYLTLDEFIRDWGGEELSSISVLIFEKSLNEGIDMKKYEEEVSPLIDEVKDILLELSDENWDDPKGRFIIDVKPIGPLKNREDKLRIDINIHRDSGFVRSDVYPVLDRVDEYLLSEGYCKYGSDIFDGYNCNVIYRPR